MPTPDNDALARYNKAVQDNKDAQAQAQAAVANLHTVANSLHQQVTGQPMAPPAMSVEALLAKRNQLAQGHDDQDMLDRRNALLAARQPPPGEIDMGSEDVPRDPQPDVQRGLSPDMLRVLARLQGSQTPGNASSYAGWHAAHLRPSQMRN